MYVLHILRYVLTPWLANRFGHAWCMQATRRSGTLLKSGQCNKSLRNAVHLWANLSREFCPRAATYYAALRAKGKSYACTLRALGQRWLKIVWKTWQRTLYDADLLARNRLKHGSWVLQLVNRPAATKT